MKTRSWSGMFLHEVAIQMRRYLYVSVTALIVLVACDVSSILLEKKMVAMELILLIRTVAWFLVVCYLAFELFHYGNGENDYQSFTMPGKKANGLVVRAVTFFCILFVYTIVESPLLIHTLSTRLSHADMFKVVLFDRLSRTAGIAAFILIFMVCSYVSFISSNVVFSAIIAVGVYLIVSIAQGCAILMPKLLHKTGMDWAFGVNFSFIGSSQFVNIIPVMVWSKGKADGALALSTVSIPTLVINVATMVVFYLIWRIVSSRVSVNYIK
ncbi:hypothetical protein [Bifidobacterium bombi]|uniref:Uncharacterized protein n=1 Tax=Bifidobacterium bombi DSM 19703 TaxID=1341695 RepID=A0A080N1U1_9BIFI|nr:hypothetical protein [Bifidobacterium bombi]KFF30803.1 hypothetical protein BBOMB_0114 [Bifidobacterium bombi DSM 19703]